MDLVMRKAEKADQTAVLALLNEVFSEGQRTASKRDAAYWDWKFCNSPFGPSLLLVAESQGRLVAVNNWWSWSFSLRGKVLRAYQPCDTAVAKDFRGKGLFKTLRLEGLRMAREEGIGLIYNFPNQNSLPGYLSLGWHRQASLPWMVRVLRPWAALRSFKAGGKTRSLPLEDAYLLQVDILEEAGQQISPYDAVLRTHLVNGFFEWRYLQHPFRHYGMVAVSQGRKSCAAVFTVNEQGPHRELVVVDLLGAPSLFPKVMQEVLDAGRHLGANYVALMQNSFYGTAGLWRQGFVPYAYKNMVVLPLDWGLETQVRAYDRWSLVAGLHDSV